MTYLSSMPMRFRWMLCSIVQVDQPGQPRAAEIRRCCRYLSAHHVSSQWDYYCQPLQASEELLLLDVHLEPHHPMLQGQMSGDGDHSQATPHYHQDRSRDNNYTKLHHHEQ